MLVGDGWAFVHIPKCGGTSVRAVLHGKEISEILPMFPWNTVSHEFHWVARKVHPGSFTFVRHPVSWLCSYWSERFREEGRFRDPRLPGRILDQLWSDDPGNFLLKVATYAPGYVGKLFDAYTAYAVNVYKLEDGIAPVLSRVSGTAVIVPTKNAGRELKIIKRAKLLVISKEQAMLKKYGYLKC